MATSSRQRRKHRCIFLVAIMCCSLSACVTSTNPVSDPAKSKPDSRLYGVWVSENKSGTATVWVIGRHRKPTGKQEAVPPGMMTIAGCDIGKSGVVSGEGSQPFFVTSFRGFGVMNLPVYETEALPKGVTRIQWGDAKIQAYRLAKYKVSDNRLEIWVGAPANVKSVVTAGLLKGTPNKSGLADTSENLARFIRNGGDAKLFAGGSRVFTRVFPK